MKVSIGICIALIVVVTLHVSHLSAQERFPHQSDLKDDPPRFEGIRQYEDVSVGKLTLLSARVIYNESPPLNPVQYNMSIFLGEDESSENIEVVLEDNRNKSYYMVPIIEKWGKGVQEFGWNSDYAINIGLDLYDLYAKAEVKELQFAKTVYPVILYYTVKPNIVDGYQFIFTSIKKSTLRYHLYDEQGGELITKLLKHQPSNSEIIIELNLADAEPGKYILFIEYTLTGNGTVESGLSDTYDFLHVKRYESN